jgi:hypothetical protein
MSEYKPNNHHESDEPNKEALDALFRQKMAETRLNVPSMTTAPEAVVFGYTLAANKDLAQQLQQFEDTQVAPQSDEQLALTAGKSKELVLAKKSTELLIDPKNQILDAEVEWEEKNNTEATDSEPETDAYGNPVNHDHAWSPNFDIGPAAISAFKPYGELPQYTTQPDRKPDRGPLAIEAKKEDETDVDKTIEYVLPEELQNQIKQAADHYALITARDRHSSIFVGRYSKDPQSAVGRLMHIVPGFAKLRSFAVDKMDTIGSGDYESHTQKIEQAKGFYEQRIAEAKKFAEEKLREIGVDEKELLLRKQFLDGWADYELAERITTYRQNESDNTNRFTDWWVSQDDAKHGKIKKAAAVAAIAAGAATAASIAVAFAPVSGAAAIAVSTLGSGSLVGGVTGGLVGNHINKRRANAKSYVMEDGKYKRDSQGNKIKHSKTTAERQADKDQERRVTDHTNYIKNIEDDRYNGEYQTAWNTAKVETQTAAEVKRNRERIKKAKMVGALAGAATGALISVPKEIFTHDSQPAAPEGTGSGDPSTPPATPETPTVPEAPSFNGENFTVEYGSGYTNELMQFAQANGHNLSPSQAYQLHEHLMSKFGADYININGPGSDIYSQAGDIRLSTPGHAQWVNGVTAEAQKWMLGKGLW